MLILKSSVIYRDIGVYLENSLSIVLLSCFCNVIFGLTLYCLD